MNKSEIQAQYRAVATKIEEIFAHVTVPMDVMHFYLLVELIAISDFRVFEGRYGRAPIDVDFARIGKDEYLNLGLALTTFETEAASLWNDHVAQLERKDQVRKEERLRLMRP